MAAAERSFPERIKLSQQTANLAAPSRFCICSRMLLPALSRSFIREAEATARLRAAQTAIATERFRRARGKVLPATLEQLVPSYLTCVPADPCDGKPLRFKLRGSGYVIYSIGKDGQDDGGLEPSLDTPNAPHDITFIVER